MFACLFGVSVLNDRVQCFACIFQSLVKGSVAFVCGRCLVDVQEKCLITSCFLILVLKRCFFQGFRA